MEKKVKNKKFTTLDELMDETLGKKGTPKRDKFDNKSRKETKRDLKNVIKGKGTLIDMDVITREDLKEYTYGDMLDKAYGKKGTPTRIAAEKRIKKIAQNLLTNIGKKEAKEEKEKLANRIKKVKIQVNCIHYKGGKKVKLTKRSVFVSQDVADGLKGLQEAKQNEALFLKFATEFSKKASRISAGDKFPSVYINNSIGQFRVDYYLKIRDRKTGKIIPTPARINLTTGIMEVSKTAFVKYTKPQRIKVLLSLYAKWVNKNELSDRLKKIKKGGKPLFNKDWVDEQINGNKNGKGSKQIKSTKVLVKRKPKKGNASKVRKGKKNPIGQKNSKKSGSIK